ncbi:MAG: hypothetical protein P8Z81_03320 [Deinococcales bacterium]
MSGDAHVRDLLADRALGLLEPEDERRLEAALDASPELRAEAKALRSALYAVPVALEPATPAPGSWEALHALLHAGEAPTPASRTTGTPGADAASDGEATTGGDRTRSAASARPAGTSARPAGTSARPAAASPSRPRQRRVRRLSLGLVTLAAVLVFTALWGVLQQRRATLQAHEQAVVAYWMRVPGMQVVPLEAVTRQGWALRPGVVCVLPDGRAMVLQPHPAPAGRTYVVYGMTGTGRVELGSTRGTLIEFHAGGLQGVELAIPGPDGGVVAQASLP